MSDMEDGDPRVDGASLVEKRSFLTAEMPRTTAFVKKFGLIALIVIGGLFALRFMQSLLILVAIVGVIALITTRSKRANGNAPTEEQLVGPQAFRVDPTLGLQVAAILSFLAATTADWLVYVLAVGVDVRVPEGQAQAAHLVIIVAWIVTLGIWVAGLVVSRTARRAGRPAWHPALAAGLVMGAVQISSWVISFAVAN